MKPNFLFVGAAKCGSTWFYRVLDSHPEVFVPAAKDLYYFDEHYHRGAAWYERFFVHSPPRKAVGELSHDYLFSDVARHRITQDLPEVRLLACVRNPVERALSAFEFMRRNGTAAATFRETLEQHPRVLERGRYGPYLEAWREAFGDRFRVFLFDDLQRNPDQVARDLFAHLGVSLEFCSPRTRERVLPASKARSVAAASLAKQGARFLRAAGLPGIVGRAKGSALAKLLYRPLASGERYRPGTSELEWLTGYYAGDLPRMEAFLGRPLPGWPGSA